MLQRTALSLVISAGSLLLLGTANLICGADSPPRAAARAVKGETYYTQFSLFHEDYLHETTNYRKQTLVPVNTPVTFVRLRTGSERRGEPVVVNPGIIVKLPDGKELHIANVKKYSGEDLDGIFARTLGKEKVDLSSFTELERVNILDGQVEPGMGKAAVLRAMGYPPKHETPSLASNDWTYWKSRASTFVVHFREDKVAFVR